MIVERGGTERRDRGGTAMQVVIFEGPQGANPDRLEVIVTQPMPNVPDWRVSGGECIGVRSVTE